MKKKKDIVRGYSKVCTDMESRLTACAQLGLLGQLSDVTSDDDKMGLNSKGCSQSFLLV